MGRVERPGDLKELNAAMGPHRRELKSKLWKALSLAMIAHAMIAHAMTGPSAIQARAAKTSVCTRIVLTGEVNQGQEWKQPFGQGWMFRLVPVQPGKRGYSGWDMVVDRDPSAGYPDALLVATPPYYSISEREVGTTFGLRAQDAIGWNPRSFHFLTDPEALRQSQKLFRSLGETKIWTEAPFESGRHESATHGLLEINRKSSAGQLRILNARLTPGIADAAPFAEKWARQSSRTPHTIAPSSGAGATPLGELDWIRFSITLWLPAGWKAPRELGGARSPCSE